MISIKSQREIELMKKTCHLAASTLNYLESKLEGGDDDDSGDEIEDQDLEE